jgi:hypothetical protein
MRTLVTRQRHADASALIDDVRSVGYKVQAAKPVGKVPPSHIAAATSKCTEYACLCLSLHRASHWQHCASRAAPHPGGGAERAP